MAKRTNVSRNRYPVLYAYGTRHEFLDVEAAKLATTEDRIRSIWPFIVNRVISFHFTLRPRERVNFDPEDVLIELFVVLSKKDAQWSPERGRYITFAGVIIDRELCAIRDSSRTVESPRNSTVRMREYKEEEKAGTISSRRAGTANDIRRSSEGTNSISVDSGTDARGGSANWHPTTQEGPTEILIGNEDGDQFRAAIKNAIFHSQLTPLEACVVGRTVGLWGNSKRTIKKIAEETERDHREVRRALWTAHQKIRQYLLSVNHPVTQNLN